MDDKLALMILKWLTSQPSEQNTYYHAPIDEFPPYSRQDVVDTCMHLVDIGFIKGATSNRKDYVKMYGVELAGRIWIKKTERGLASRMIDYAKDNDVKWIYATIIFILGVVFTKLFEWILNL